MPENVAARIKQLRKGEGLSQTQFAAKIGYTQVYLSNIEVGKRPPKPRFLDAICNAFNVNPGWLQEGRGDIFQQTETETEAETFRRLLKAKIRALPPAAQDMVLELCEDIQAALKDKETDNGD